MADCIWGALDGVNGDGLSIALAFGGRNAIGDGFSAPLICRYILQTCSNIADARSALARLPVYMPYTFAVLDASGDFLTAFLGPDIEASFVKRRASTNHQRSIDWPKYANFVETAERLELIEPLVDPSKSLAEALQTFLSPPVWRTHYDNASGTLYIAEYSCSEKTLSLHWPCRTERFDLNDTLERSFSVSLPDPPVR
jgi:predicted choloylglycine hydrolase